MSPARPPGTMHTFSQLFVSVWSKTIYAGLKRLTCIGTPFPFGNVCCKGEQRPHEEA
jgi:hypothetical protein